MCRLTVYKGKSFLIGDLVVRPEHGLLYQSRDAGWHPGVTDGMGKRNIRLKSIDRIENLGLWQSEVFQYNGIQTSPLFSQVCIHPQICSEEKFNALVAEKSAKKR